MNIIYRKYLTFMKIHLKWNMKFLSFTYDCLCSYTNKEQKGTKKRRNPVLNL